MWPRLLCDAGQPAALSLIAPECNSFGLALMGARPLSEAVALTGKDRTVIVLENDLYRHLPAKTGGRLSGISGSRHRARSSGEPRPRQRPACFFPPPPLPSPTARWSATKGERNGILPVFRAPDEMCGRVGDGCAIHMVFAR